MKRFFFVCLWAFTFSIAFSQDKPEGLFINSKAQDFKGKDQSGNEVSLRDLRKKGPVVVLFYMGNWNPYCNKELQRFQDSLQYITDKGAQVIAITAEGTDGIAKTVSKTNASFPILHDEELKISNNYHVAYLVDEIALARYKNAGIDLLTINGQKDKASLPVPAVYIVNKEGSVSYRYFDTDYRRRISVSEVLKNL